MLQPCAALVQWVSGPSQISTSKLVDATSTLLGVDSPFFSAIVLSKNRSPFPRVFGGVLERPASLDKDPYMIHLNIAL